MAENTGSTSAEGVTTESLAEIIQEWIDDWQRDRPLHNMLAGKVAFQNAEREFTTALDYLQQKSGINKRSIKRILSRSTKFTSLQLADSLLVAMGLEHVLRTRLTVIPNPQWSMENWRAYMIERGCEPE